ncbi:cell division protein ZapE [Stutzerimonas tarimensis]|uniref:Cell division protein ZapE n=1 Tax=Stutzerimonas tarimensis TaxID=1507735 RepID=A0ABV7T327_9GAMM
MTSDALKSSRELPRQLVAPGIEQHFDQLLEARGYRADPAQSGAIRQLAGWCEDWLRGRGSWLRRPAAGMYLWGGVGRGKSFVMDAFFNAAPLVAKRRVHFHAFLHEIQLNLRQLTGRADPLALVAREIAAETRLLCFDEFHVHDIGDAMLLGRLLTCLVEEGVGLVCTSNYPPRGLCPNPLYRDRFEPAIALIEKRFAVVNLDGGEDYRERPGHVWGEYRVAPFELQADAVAEGLPLSEAAEREVSLDVHNRPLRLLAHEGERAWATFDELCRLPRASADFLWLSEGFRHLAVSGVPPLDGQGIDVQQRFLNLVDILYDGGNQLLLVSEASPETLLSEGAHTDFSRTRSRLRQLRVDSGY